MNMPKKDVLKGRSIVNKGVFEQANQSIDEIKRSNPLSDYFKSKGVDLKPGGNGQYMGLCPFHDDHNPSLSVNADKNVFKCFGCGKSGTIIDAVSLFDNLTTGEAIRLLQGKQQKINDKPFHPLTGKKETKKDQTDIELKLDLPKTKEKPLNLNEVINFYHKKLYENHNSIEYLKSRCITTPELLQRFKIGFADGSLLNVIGESQRKELTEAGIINQYGYETFNNCLIFPIIDDNENTIGLYGRNINPDSKHPHIYLKGKHRGVFNRKTSKIYDEIILTESIIDCLSLIELGFQNVQSIYGVNGFTEEHLQILKDDRVKTIIIAFDNDSAGITASETIKDRLINENISVKIIAPTVKKDWNEELINGIIKDEIQSLIDNVQIFKKTEEKEDFECEEKKGTYYFKTDGLKYRIIGFNKTFTTELKVNIRVYRNELNTFKVLNLYNESSVESLVRNVSEELGISGDTVKRHLRNIINFFEDEREKFFSDYEDRKKIYVLSHSEETEALNILTGSDLFEDHLFPDLEKMGLVGELVNKQACYLAVVSRLTRRPINICTLSTYGTGKSFLHDTIHKLVPDEDLKSYARITKNDLYYREDENAFLGKVLSVDEIEGLGESLYSIRTLISSGILSISYTSMNPETGKLSSRENKVIGRPSIFCTGTSDEIIDAETLSRFLLLTTDISNEQRFKIKQRQFYEMSLEGVREKMLTDEIISKHKNLLRMIKNIEVIFPESWKKELKNMKDGDYSIRDNLCYLSLIIAFGIKEQHTRKIYTDITGKKEFRYIESSKNDVIRANHIMREIFGKSLSDLTPPQRHFLKVVQDYANQMMKGKNITMQDVSFYERDIREFSGMSAWQVNHYLNDLVKLEYVILDTKGKHNRRSYRLEIGEHIDNLTENNTKYLTGLIDPSKL